MSKKRSSRPSLSKTGIVERLCRFSVELPSWGFSNTGTRFGKYLQDAAAVDLEDKLADAGIVNKFTGAAPSVAVHALWDFPNGFDNDVLKLARKHRVKIGAVNPNIFQDQCYKFGSITNRDPAIRRRAVKHILDCVELARQAKSRYVSLWFADGANYPGQADIRQRKSWATQSLKKIHSAMPAGMTLLVEYKPFEPAAYFTDFFDWGSSYILAKAAGPKAKVLVDIGHHLPGTNVEQIVAWLIDEKMLGGFHFNDRKYADEDLTAGSIDPYQLFRIFNEIASWEHQHQKDLDISYVIDQSHNIKPKVQASIQTICTAQEIFAKAMMVDREALANSQALEDTVASEQVLLKAFHTDVDDILRRVRRQNNAYPDPLDAYRKSGYEEESARRRAEKRREMNICEGGSYA